MIKYLHIMHTGNKAATNTYIKFIEAKFNKDEHHFLFTSDGIDDEYKSMSNVTTMKSYNDKLIMKYIKNSQYVFCHSLSFSIRSKITLIVHPKLLDKIVWIAWGMDLYETKPEKNPAVKAFKRFITNEVKKRIKYFIGIFPPDIKVFKSKYGDKAKTFYAPYCSVNKNVIYAKPPVLRPINDKLSKGETLNIMIGHQSTPMLNHIKMIDTLSKFTDNNIQIYIPLSYGFKDYAAEVGEYAKRRLGDKVTVMTEYIPYEEYMRFLSSIDIAVFDCERQIGLGNVTPLLYMQKKVFFNSNGVMYKYYCDEGMQIYKSDEICNMSYADLIKEDDLKINTDIVKKHTDIEYKIRLWKEVFDYLK